MLQHYLGARLTYTSSVVVVYAMLESRVEMGVNK